jgi:hypothetical protein
MVYGIFLVLQHGDLRMKVTNKKIVITDTKIEVSREDLINALNASGNYNIPYNARIWFKCEGRNEFDLTEDRSVNIRFNLTESVPEEKEETIPF